MANCQNFTSIATAEPPVRFFTGSGCGGTRFDYYPNSYPNLPGSMTDSVSSVVVPGHLRVEMYDSGGLDPNNGMKILNPGVYDSLTAIGWNDRMASMNIFRLKEWDQFKIDCCKGIGDATLCQQFWGPSNTDGSCDAMMINYCENNTTDTQTCGCINSELPAPSCFDLNCTTKGGYQTSQMKTRAQNCGNMTYVDCRMLENQIAIGNGSVDKISFTQNCGVTGGGDIGGGDNNGGDGKTQSTFWKNVGTFVKNNQTTLIIGAVSTIVFLIVLFLVPNKKLGSASNSTKKETGKTSNAAKKESNTKQ
jgi:hypothetical protein